MTKRSTMERIKMMPIIVLLFCGLYGLIASFVLTLEKIALLKDPTTIPSCSLNPIISCSSAINSSQATTFGIPNTLFGIVAYTALIVVAGLLLVKVSIDRKIWIAIVTTAFVGLGGVLYLILQSVLVLHVICPWCFGIWVTTPIVVLSVCILYNRLGDAVSWYSKIIRWIAHNAKQVAFIWYSGFVLLLLTAFWDFWSSLLPL